MVRSEVPLPNNHGESLMKPLYGITPAGPISLKPLECSFRIISNSNFPESFICIENSVRKRVSDFPQEGVRRAVEHVFRYLGRHREGELWLTPKEKPWFIGDIDTKAHLHGQDGWNVVEFSSMELLYALHVIAWAHQDRFAVARGIFSTGARICTICGKTQQGSIVGYNNMGTINPIYRWPAETCINPDCLSHALDEAVDPTYQAPRDELRVIDEAEKNRKDAFLESVQQALDKAGMLPLKNLGDR